MTNRVPQRVVFSLCVAQLYLEHACVCVEVVRLYCQECDLHMRLTQNLRQYGKGERRRIPGRTMIGRQRNHLWTCKWGGTVCGPLCQTSLPRRTLQPSSPSTQYCLEKQGGHFQFSAPIIQYFISLLLSMNVNILFTWHGCNFSFLLTF